MKTQDRFYNALQLDWYTQGTNAYPLFLAVAAYSALSMKRELGFGYEKTFVHFTDGYGEMDYSKTEMHRIWNIIKEQMAKNPEYLRTLEQRHARIMQQHRSFFDTLTKQNLQLKNDEEILHYFQQCSRALTDAVGIGHVIESISFESEQEFKKRLYDELIDTKQFYTHYTQLTAPSEPSFVSSEEASVEHIATLQETERDSAIMEHIRKYHWVQNTYAGARPLTPEIMKERLQTVSVTARQTKVEQKKVELIKKLKISMALQQLIEIIDFTTIWQDTRKMYVLEAISYLDVVAHEVAQRSAVPYEQLRFVVASEIQQLKSLQNIQIMQEELQQRMQAVSILMEDGREYVLSGYEAKAFLQERQKRMAHHITQQADIHGSVANVGTAIGRVCICKEVADMKFVQEGDVLVTSMTRPELMPALKKVAAIVTDEGGITSHAAIVARELNIPAVIGTKIATKVLKNGMIVEVRANHGIVKIVNK